jgi:hypothetical protein
MKAALSSRQQGLLQRAEKERAALLEAALPLRQPLQWLDRLSPWLALGLKLGSTLARARRRREF